VAVLASCNAWAVGGYFNGTGAEQTLIVHWNGSAWTQTASPNPGGPSNDNILVGVAVTPARSAWAVGRYFNGNRTLTLIEHWNGTAWRQVASPNPAGGSPVLSGVAATSARSAWAVGLSNTAHVLRTLIEHWNGTAWRRVASPNPGGPSNENVLSGVAATSATNIWAVGLYSNGTATQTLALHCC